MEWPSYNKNELSISEHGGTTVSQYVDKVWLKITLKFPFIFSKYWISNA